MKKVYQKSRELNLNFWIFTTHKRVIELIKTRFCTPARILYFFPPTFSNLKEREVVKGFFQQKEVLPCWINFNEIGEF
jgi:hypothetical protein